MDTETAEFGYELNTIQLLNYEQVLEATSKDTIQIVDVRDAEVVQKRGQIPKSFNLPTSEMLTSRGGSTKSVEEMRKAFEEKGIDLGKPMAFHCNSGIGATFGFACAMKMALQTKIYMYDGSYCEYEVRNKIIAA